MQSRSARSFRKCPYCDVQFASEQLQHHMTGVCPRRPMTECHVCGVTLSSFRQEQHLKRDCPAIIVACARCGMEMARKDLDRHWNESCPKRAIQSLDVKPILDRCECGAELWP